METFTRTISVSCNLLATASRLDRSRLDCPGVAALAAASGPPAVVGLVTGDGRRHVLAGKKSSQSASTPNRGLEVGKTKKGKGTKLMLMTDGQGLPLSAFTTSAQDAEVNTVETLVDVCVLDKRPDRLLYDKAADADWLRDALEPRGIEQITPHRKSRKKPSRQDGRALRRYKHRWKVERTISWLGNFRRLLVRHEYHAHLFEGFTHWACLLLCIRWL
jgi:transposase